MRKPAVQRSIRFTASEIEYLERVSKEKGTTIHNYVHEAAMQKGQLERIIYYLQTIIDDMNRLHYETAMIQETGKQQFAYVLATLYQLMEQNGHKIKLDKEERDLMDKALGSSEKVLRVSFDNIVNQIKTNKGQDPFLSKEFLSLNEKEEEKSNKK